MIVSVPNLCILFTFEIKCLIFVIYETGCCFAISSGDVGVTTPLEIPKQQFYIVDIIKLITCFSIKMIHS